MGWMDKPKKVEAEALAKDADPWRDRLSRLRGKVGDDGKRGLWSGAAANGRPGDLDRP